ncbi:MAG: hypothetical protein KatS3mg115_2602 [Candidatus Poribacteria bacterium]|nr:MAG: hypothetical protein KatS3mg115_2602 [Candidatus Poribacteria bacterium]
MIVVESDPGMIGGSTAHEFMLVTPSGEDRLILDEVSGYTANAEVAVFDKGKPNFGEPAPIEEVATPGCTTIEEVAQYLGVPTAQTMKAVFYVTEDGRFIFAVIRGDLEINETKLKKAVGAAELRPARPEEIRAIGAVARLRLSDRIERDGHRRLDDSIPNMTNGVAGANKEGYHLKNVNYPRDFSADVVADIALAKGGYKSAFSDGLLREVHGIEVGNIFKLGTKYSAAMNATFLDEEGKERLLIMGCYGIGVGRLLAAVVEAHHDEDGIIFPISVAPYHVHLVPIGKAEAVMEEAERLYQEWTQAGIEGPARRSERVRRGEVQRLRSDRPSRSGNRQRADLTTGRLRGEASLGARAGDRAPECVFHPALSGSSVGVG